MGSDLWETTRCNAIRAQAVALAAMSLGALQINDRAAANINLELRPAAQTVTAGEVVSLELFAVSDDDTNQLMSAAQVILTWDPDAMQLLGVDNTGAISLLFSDFPAGDPHNLNEVVPPQDGDGLYSALASLGTPVATTPEGILLTTFQFLAIADTPATPVDMPPTGGDPEGETIVFDGTVPNTDVTGVVTGASVEILPSPKLVLIPDVGSGPVEPGDFVVVTVAMRDLGENEAAGFQAFLEFDSTELTFITGGYTAEPFGLPIIDPIVAAGEHIDLASGIDPVQGQMPTSADADLVNLTFQTLVGGCVTSVSFREHKPPTRLTDDQGDPILPLALISLPDEPPSPDITQDGAVDAFDLATLLGDWGPCPAPPTLCPADLNCDQDVNPFDLAILLGAWGPV